VSTSFLEAEGVLTAAGLLVSRPLEFDAGGAGLAPRIGLVVRLGIAPFVGPEVKLAGPEVNRVDMADCQT